MATITPPDYAKLAGIPQQWSDELLAAAEGFIVGDTPAVVTEDMTFAINQTIMARTPVGFNAAGDLVPATPLFVAAALAAGVLTFSGAGTVDDTITIGSDVYTLKAAPTTVARQVKIGATAAETAANLAAAINGGAGAGSLYGSLTVPHATVQAISTGAVVNLQALSTGTAANSISTTESGTSTSFGASTLTGGTDAVGVRAVGFTIIDVVVGGSIKAAPVYRAGVFNPALANWPAGFNSLERKLEAFRGAPAPTNIIMRPVKTATVALP